MFEAIMLACIEGLCILFLGCFGAIVLSVILTLFFGQEWYF